jgi:hypothetical protein
MANNLLYKASLHLGASPQKKGAAYYKIQTVGDRQQFDAVGESLLIFSFSRSSNPLAKSWALLLVLPSGFVFVDKTQRVEILFVPVGKSQRFTSS